MKLTKAQRGNVNKAMDMLGTPGMDREEVYEMLRPSATSDMGSAFFTPWELARSFQIETLCSWPGGRPKKVLDLCAGYGVLGILQAIEQTYRSSDGVEVTCVESCHEYVEIGRKLFPEAEWLHASVFDLDILLAGRKFDEFYANPPFGSLKGNGRWEYAVAEIGMKHADMGTMIVPRGCTNWEYSGRQTFLDVPNEKYEAWSAKSGLRMSPNCGIDCCDEACGAFHGAKVVVEIVNVERNK